MELSRRRITLLVAILMLAMILTWQSNEIGMIMTRESESLLRSMVNGDETVASLNDAQEEVAMRNDDTNSGKGSLTEESVERKPGWDMGDKEPKTRYYLNSENITVKYWRWSKIRRAILYIKIPKTGGTTLADSFTRLANHSRWIFAKPFDRAHVKTCGPDAEAESNWRKMLLANGGQISVFALHACFRPFMRDKRAWTVHSEPAVITMMRHPWAHYISKYRYAKVCCERDWHWCEAICPKDANGARKALTHTHFNEVACKNGRCNEQRFYMGSGTADRILNDFNLVLILERIDEGLVLLQMQIGLPFEALPYLRENSNELVKMPTFSIEYQKHVQNTVLLADIDLYKRAVERFDAIIESFPEEKRAIFNATLARLRNVNKELSIVCEEQCSGYQSLTKVRKMCDHRCVEQMLDKLDPSK